MEKIFKNACLEWHAGEYWLFLLFADKYLKEYSRFIKVCGIDGQYF